MFIKPIDASTLPPATWQDRSGNLHFILQSRKSRSLFANLTILQPHLKKLADFEFRILLKCLGKKMDYVVAVDDTFEKIHATWTWIEQNVIVKVRA